jgi:hypothetical protein
VQDDDHEAARNFQSAEQQIRKLPPGLHAAMKDEAATVRMLTTQAPVSAFAVLR